MSLPLTAKYASAQEFLEAFEAEVSRGGLLVRGVSTESTQAMAEDRVAVQIAGFAPVEVPAQVAAIIPGVGVAVVFGGVPPQLRELAQQLGAPSQGQATPPDPEPEANAHQSGLVSERLKALTVSQKMQLALSASREERLALIRDPNRTLHVFVLKNPRIGIDEVQYASKLPGLSPDAIKLISEHQEWGRNAVVCSALVRNPKTPLPIALKLLERIPASDLRTLAKGGARDQIVHAARKKVVG
jgi:hypothetical protein